MYSVLISPPQTAPEHVLPLLDKSLREVCIYVPYRCLTNNYLKGKEFEKNDKAFCHFVKKSCFQLLDLPAVGIRKGISMIMPIYTHVAMRWGSLIDWSILNFTRCLSEDYTTYYT